MKTTTLTSGRYALVGSILLFSILLVANYAVFFVGYIASDDSIYIHFARKWLEDGFTLPALHWGFRYTVVLPLYGLEWGLKKPPELSYSFIPLTYTLATGAVTIYAAWRWIGNRAALAASLLLATMPLLVIQSSIVNVDLPEALFLTCSLVTFYAATIQTESQRAALLFLSGLMLGLAMLNRETGYGLILLFGLLFLRGAYFSRALYLWGFVGVAFVIGLEWLFYIYYGESPLYRFFTITQSHGNPTQRGGDFLPNSGNVSDDRLLGPVLALLLNQEFALLFFATSFASVWIHLRKALSPVETRLFNLVLLAGLIFFVWIGYAGAVRPLPRYFAFLAILAVFPIAMFYQKASNKLLANVFLLILVLANYVGLMVENTHPRFPSRALLAYSQAHGQTLATDPLTEGYLRQLTQFLRIPTDSVVREFANAGETVLFAEVKNREYGGSTLAQAWLSVKQQENYRTVDEINPPKLPIGYLLDASQLTGLLSPDFYRWLAIRNPSVHIHEFSYTPANQHD